MAATITNDDVSVYELTVTAFQWGRDPNTQVWYKGEVIYSADLNPMLKRRLVDTNSVKETKIITHRAYMELKKLAQA